MDTNKMREDFEAWVLREYPNQTMGRFNDGEYHSTTVQHCWLAWQASRQELAVELPDTEWFGDSWSGGWAISRENIIEAIEAAGLKVRP